MNQDLWNSILAFDLDDPPGEYSFSIRLAAENYWTKAFTEQAILEYKKFMYLAATSDRMVSPSGIVDEVWHQHLIFTKSYHDFCAVLGKTIQHVPSTHNREEFQKFKQAKERTTQLYEEVFGPQPVNIWAYNDMFESLHLPKARLKMRAVIITVVLILLVLTKPAYKLLLPVYNKIDNPLFLTGFLFLSVSSIILLHFYTKHQLRAIVKQFDLSCFIFKLHPFELIYLKTQKTYAVINGAVNEMIENGSIKISKKDGTFQLTDNIHVADAGQAQIVSSLAAFGTTTYPDLAMVLAGRPIFSNVPHVMDEFRKYFTKSKKFSRIFYVNFGLLLFLLWVGFLRVLTGSNQHKASEWIEMTVFALLAITIFSLSGLTRQVCIDTIPNLYKKQILESRPTAQEWQWQYFLMGAAALAVPFMPLAKDALAKNESTGGGCGSSCGGGGSCGGCGGCGG